MAMLKQSWEEGQEEALPWMLQLQLEAPAMTCGASL
jgi:hypothetical protein